MGWGSDVELFRKAIESSNDLIAAADKNYVYRFVNEAFLEYLELERGDVVGSHVSDVVGDQVFRDVLKPRIDRCLEGEGVRWEMRQGERWLDVSYQPLRWGEQSLVQGVFAVMRDVTKAKRDRQELALLTEFHQTIIENANVWLDVLDTDGRVVVWNRAAEEISGYRSEEVVGHRRIWEWLYPDQEYREYVTETAGRIIEDREMVKDFETRIKTKDGDERVISWYSRGLKDGEGGIIGSVALGRDITDRKKAVEEVEERNKELMHRVAMEMLVTQLSTRFIGCPSCEVDKQLDTALRKIGEFTGVDRSYIFLFSNDGETMSNTHEWCAPKINPQIENLQQLPTNTFPWWMEKLKKFENIHIPKVSDLPEQAEEEKQILEAQDIRSVLVVPLVMGGSTNGFMGLDSVNRAKTWPELDIKLLRTIAGAISSTLERKQAEHKLRESEERYRTIFESANDAVVLLSPEGRVLEINQKAGEIFGHKPKQFKGLWDIIFWFLF